MSLPKSSLNGNFPDNSEFQLSDSMSAPDELNRKVIEGKAVEGKSNVFTQARDTMLYPDGESVGSTIMETVVTPAIRNLASNVVGSFFDIVVDSINRMIFKDDPTGGPTGGKYVRGGGINYVSYGSVFNSSGYYRDISPSAPSGYRNSLNSQAPMSANPTIPNRYSNIIFESRGDAETFIDNLLDTVNRYQTVNVANVYAQLGWPSSFQDTKWGWTPDQLNPGTIIKRRVANGAWRIQLPRPIALDI